jgi:hypothetical protein
MHVRLSMLVERWSASRAQPGLSCAEKQGDITGARCADALVVNTQHPAGCTV